MKDWRDNLAATSTSLHRTYNRAAWALLVLAVLNLLVWHAGVALNGVWRHVAVLMCRASWSVSIVFVVASLCLVVLSRQRIPLWTFFFCFVAATVIYVEGFLVYVYD